MSGALYGLCNSVMRFFIRISVIFSLVTSEKEGQLINCQDARRVASPALSRSFGQLH